jgi:hypothetical protein
MIAIVVTAFAVAAPPIEPTTLDRQIVDSLRDVHDRGAKLHNDSNDAAGCHRLYEGALRTVRPLLGHHPDVQNRIDTGLAKIETLAGDRDKAFALHELIEAVRGDLKALAKLREVAPAPQPRTPIPAPAPVPLTGLPATAPVLVRLPNVTVTLNGQPIGPCEVQFVSLDRATPTIVTVATNATGEATASLAPGKYAVTVTGENIPARYATTTESGVRVAASSAPIVLALKK